MSKLEIGEAEAIFQIFTRDFGCGDKIFTPASFLDLKVCVIYSYFGSIFQQLLNADEAELGRGFMANCKVTRKNDA